MNLRYFFINDYIKYGDISIEHCDTNNMLGDYFTKPLQGKTFLKLRDVLMNFDPNDKFHSNHRSVLRNDESCVSDDVLCVMRIFRRVTYWYLFGLVSATYA